MAPLAERPLARSILSILCVTRNNLEVAKQDSAKADSPLLLA